MSNIRIAFANIVGGMIFHKEIDDRNLYTKYWPSKYVETYAELEPDILCFAEAPFDTADGQGKFVDDTRQAMGATSVRTLVDGKSWLVEGKYTGTAVFSKHPEVSYRVLDLPPANMRDERHGEVRIMHDKKVQEITVKIGDAAVNVFNLHYYPFSAFGRSSLDPEVQEINQQLVDILTEDLSNPTIVTGDFNHSDEPELLTVFPGLLGDRSLAQAARFTEEDFLEYEKSIQIDHVLYSPRHFTVRGHRVVVDKSDHHGIVVDLSLGESIINN